MDAKELTVVFGDPELEWCRPLRTELRNEGARVSAATSTHEVLALAARHPPDVIVVGEGLEPMGRDLLVRLLRHQAPRGQIILVRPENVAVEEGDLGRLGLLASFGRPVSLPELGTAIRRSAQAGPPPPRRPLIMCVDDDALHLRSLERILRRRGYSVVGFEDPERALESLPVARPDLLFLDILMPGMSGLDLAEQVREQFADTLPVVLLTARGSDREIADGYRKGATHYITKPCDPRAVLGIADYLLGQEGAAGSVPEGPAEASVTPPDSGSEDRPPSLSRRHTVVCVDDEPQILSSLRRLLRNEPYDVLTTERPEEALEWVERKDVSLLISDQRMPEMQGTQLLEEVFRRSPVTARIILTGYPGSTVRIQGLKQGIQLLVYKPWEDAMLRRTIRRLLHEREIREGIRGAAGTDGGS